jgi:glycyl-tRNA synthetase beta chain
VAFLCERLDEKSRQGEALQAAALCKVDLLTDMVREFPSLQGKMGGLYAREEGYPPAVCQAIYEHYHPLPASELGALLSLADKLDSLVGIVGVGIQVTGSSDPFGLRRQAHGICRIILERKLRLSLDDLAEKAVSNYGDILVKPKKEILELCRAFFGQRLRLSLRARICYDLPAPRRVPLGLPHFVPAARALKASKEPRFDPSSYGQARQQYPSRLPPML